MSTRRADNSTGSTSLLRLPLLIHIVLVISAFVAAAAFHGSPCVSGYEWPINSFAEGCCLTAPHLIFPGINQSRRWNTFVAQELSEVVKCEMFRCEMVLTEAAVVFPGGQRSRTRPAVLATLWSKVHNGGPVPDWWVFPCWSVPAQ